jgi:putative flavoprotein involved in K+ transport
VRRAGALFDVETNDGALRTRNIVAAVGANSRPHIPDFAAELNPDIHQLHTSQYRSPADLPEGDVLVVGVGTSGAEIAAELAVSHRVLIAGRPTPHVPDAVLRHAGEAYWRLVHSVFTLDNPLGRKVAANFHRRGAPLIRISAKDLERAGVARLPRLTGTSAGSPAFEDGTSVDVRSVVWATGYRPSLDWIEGLALGPSGWPVTVRGAVPEIPGLYFVGMPFQYALTSGLIGGVGRDAAYVVDQLAARTSSQLTGELAGP